MSTSPGTPPRSGLYLMPFPLLPSPIHARSASHRPCGTQSLTAPLVRSIWPPYRTSAALSTYAVSISRRSPPTLTPSLPVPPRGLTPLLLAPLPASAGPRTSPTCHYLASLSLRHPYTTLTSLKLHCVSSPLSPLLEFPCPPSPLTSDVCWCAASTPCVGYKALRLIVYRNPRRGNWADRRTFVWATTVWP